MELNEGSATIDMLYERITTIRQLVKYFWDIHIHFFFNIGWNVTTVEVQMNELQCAMSYS